MRTWNSVESALADPVALEDGGRPISMVVLHHTYRPSHRDWRGLRSASAILAFWRRRQVAEGWRVPPGGHFLVAPDGAVFAPFDDLRLPLNANSDRSANARGVAIEAVGNFDLGHDQLEGTQRHSVLGLIGGLLDHYALGAEALWFHRSFPAAGKTCPGSSLDLATMRDAADLARSWARLRRSGEAGES